MRLAAKVDVNQAEIVTALRKAGCSVQTLHRLGQGVPDLLVGRAGNNWIMEVKQPGHKLTDDENHWMLHWCGQYAVVESAEQALHLVGLR